MKSLQKIRVLFFAENITTSQIVRLVLLAKNLNPDEYEVHFACSLFDQRIFKGTKFHQWEVFSIDKQTALRKTKKGARIYNEKILENYIREDLDLFKKINPQVVIGDFRLSLCVSTALSGVRFINLINAYWHPDIQKERFPVPEHPVVHLLGLKISSEYFPKARPFVYDYFARPVNKLRKKYGLSEIGSLCEVLTYGDQVIFPDAIELIPLKPGPGYSFIGPLIWSPENEESLPEETSEHLIYITAGSSGSSGIIPAVVKALENGPYSAIISMAEEKCPFKDSDRVIFKNFVDGNKVIDQASLVICNGGGSTAYQALAKGKPVIGIPSNLDQHLSMEFITESGAGISIRSDQLSSEKIKNAIADILNNTSFRENSERLKIIFESYSPHSRFKEILKGMIVDGQKNL